MARHVIVNLLRPFPITVIGVTTEGFEGGPDPQNLDGPPTFYVAF